MDDVRRATIYEVAFKAGVSISSVSNALNGKNKVSRETAEKIRKAAEELGYQPNQSARSLRSAKSGLIGMIVPGFDNSFYGLYFEYIDRLLKRMGYSLLCVSSMENEEKEVQLLNMMQAIQAEAVILDPTRINYDYSRMMSGYSFPVVYFDRRPASENYSGVFCDIRGAIRQTVECMVNRGRRRIAILLPETMHDAVMCRLAGYNDALDACGLPRDPMLVIRAHAGDKNGYDCTDYAVKALKADAVLTANRVLGTGTIRYLNAHGIRSGRDISVAVLGVYDWSGVLVPPITTVVEPIEPMAAQLVDLVMRLISRPDRPPEIITLDGYISEPSSI